VSVQARHFRSDHGRPEPSRCTELAGALATEARLVRRLTQAVLDQRDAIGSNKIENVEASVFALQRILQTLAQAKVNRRNILEIVGWMDVGLEDLPGVAGDAFTAELSVARDDLLQSVAHLRRELMLNGEILTTVLSGGQAFLRALVETEPAGGYSAQGGAGQAQGQALMMNKVI
jgi:flagellar biosynthesis/type III secretory pathway chaperone